MKIIHVECLPDETLVKALGYSKRSIKHHQGKSRIFSSLTKCSEQLAIVDEDPGSAKSTYERNLVLKEEIKGIKLFQDNKKNKICVLKGKFEDWLVMDCKSNNIDIIKFGLTTKPNELHEIINQKIRNLENVLQELLECKGSEIHKLKSWIQ